MKIVREKCPRCKRIVNMEYPALSRRDNETLICPDCGQEEALVDSKLTMSQEIMDRELDFRQFLLDKKFNK